MTLRDVGKKYLFSNDLTVQILCHYLTFKTFASNAKSLRYSCLKTRWARFSFNLRGTVSSKATNTSVRRTPNSTRTPHHRGSVELHSNAARTETAQALPAAQSASPAKSGGGNFNSPPLFRAPPAPSPFLCSADTYRNLTLQLAVLSSEAEAVAHRRRPRCTEDG